jgi:hypothetical protein
LIFWGAVVFEIGVLVWSSRKTTLKLTKNNTLYLTSEKGVFATLLLMPITGNGGEETFEYPKTSLLHLRS